jgi:transcriptional regulator with XRE-family HTH domain
LYTKTLTAPRLLLYNRTVRKIRGEIVNYQLLSDDDFNNLFISENLKRLRLANNLSTVQVAKIIGKSRQGYVNYETGAREISIHDLITLSGFYNVRVDDIIGNPYSNRTDKILSFRTFQMQDGHIVPTLQLSISTINDDMIALKKSDHEITFFWRTQKNQKNRIMLFEYYDRIYVSKVFFNKDKGGFFFINDEPYYFTKAHAENLIFKGVYASTLTKDLVIENFF